jgi:hypothetical protein
MNNPKKQKFVLFKPLSGFIITILGFVLLLSSIVLSGSPVYKVAAVALIVVGVALIGSAKLWEDFFNSIFMR